ncbi:MAG: AI-2E family transporter [Anaerolineales bacterium]|jgi:predicted PurR-regulated permease PerM
MSEKWGSTRRYLTFGIILGFLGLLVYYGRAMLAPLLIASLLAYLLKPLACFFIERLKMGQIGASRLAYFLFIAALTTSMVVLAPIVVRQARGLSSAIQVFLPRLEASLAEPVELLGIPVRLDNLLISIEGAFSELFAPDRVFRILVGATKSLTWVLVILVTSYYLLQDWEKLREWLIGLAPTRAHADIRKLHGQIKEVWRSYVRGQLTLMLLVGLMTAVGAAALGLPNAILLGLLAGGLDFVPTLGPAVAMAIAALVAWTQGSAFLPLSGEWLVILTLAVFGFFQLVESIWLQPRIMGRRLQMHRGVVFVAVIGSLTIGSALVALIIIPCIASVAVIGRYLHRQMLGQEVWPSSEQALPESAAEDDQAPAEESSAAIPTASDDP